MTNDPALHALVDLCEAIELEAPLRHPYDKAMKVIRERGSRTMSLSKRLLKLAESNADLTDAERKTCKEAAALVIGATAAASTLERKRSSGDGEQVK